MQQMEAVGLEIDEASWAKDPFGNIFTTLMMIFPYSEPTPPDPKSCV